MGRRSWYNELWIEMQLQKPFPRGMLPPYGEEDRRQLVAEVGSYDHTAIEIEKQLFTPYQSRRALNPLRSPPARKTGTGTKLRFDDCWDRKAPAPTPESISPFFVDICIPIPC